MDWLWFWFCVLLLFYAHTRTLQFSIQSDIIHCSCIFDDLAWVVFGTVLLISRLQISFSLRSLSRRPVEGIRNSFYVSRSVRTVLILIRLFMECAFGEWAIQRCWNGIKCPSDLLFWSWSGSEDMLIAFVSSVSKFIAKFFWFWSCGGSAVEMSWVCV